MKFFNGFFNNFKQYKKYIIGGFLNSSITYIIFIFFDLFFSYYFAYLVAYICGIFISYFYNSIIVFKTKLSIKAGFFWPFIFVFQYFVGVFLLNLFIDTLNIPNYLSALIVMILILPINFFLSKIYFKISSNLKQN